MAISLDQKFLSTWSIQLFISKEINTNLIKDSYEVDLGTNKIRIDSDGVSMVYASCPDNLCVHQGKINKKGQSVICLPNRIIIEIKGQKPKVDAVAGAR